MRLVVLGSGGREHAMARALLKGGHEVYWGPGNGARGDWSPLEDAYNLDKLQALQPDLILVGPEDPLADGLVDQLQERGLQAWGPTAAQARLESSKAWSKQFMRRHGLPSAEFAIADTLEEARAAIHRLCDQHGVVVKADGLAAGKGVVVAEDERSAGQAAQELLAKYGRLVIERRLLGQEASWILLLRPDGFQALPLARDHKRLRDGDAGPNTGGMGTVTPVESPFDLDQLGRDLFAALEQEQLNYFGALFVGLLFTSQGPQILEFNCRLGDPESEVLLESMPGDFLQALQGAQLPAWRGCCLDVVLAHPGYPETSSPAMRIEGIPEGVTVLHAGTRRDEQGQLWTAGGRVLHLVAHAENYESAQREVYAAAQKITFNGRPAHYRTDIGRTLAGRL
ncbi:MAG: phosphoribosylamine--glycine ligase [Candidatus Eremiobacteraeota bacterium]|nr:phosphoribosylamine--glycine ligase [Candidatus Eremiobacteraeota bacterium]MCW5872607.1 phosphoribosylamine--glycine ligase [Candidatus Eremiobacteraeota bacterium]